ncbi:hypothetical protein D3C73_1060130 [compost metagenome]
MHPPGHAVRPEPARIAQRVVVVDAALATRKRIQYPASDRGGDGAGKTVQQRRHHGSRSAEGRTASCAVHPDSGRSRQARRARPLSIGFMCARSTFHPATSCRRPREQCCAAPIFTCSDRTLVPRGLEAIAPLAGSARTEPATPSTADRRTFHQGASHDCFVQGFGITASRQRALQQPVRKTGRALAHPQRTADPR